MLGTGEVDMGKTEAFPSGSQWSMGGTACKQMLWAGVPGARTEVCVGLARQTSPARARKVCAEEGTSGHTLESKEIFATCTRNGGDRRAHKGQPKWRGSGVEKHLGSGPGVDSICRVLCINWSTQEEAACYFATLWSPPAPLTKYMWV